MFLNEEFLEIYEELSELNEAKADTQKLIDFAGEDLANRFLAIKNSLKGAEKDLYYWIKNKTVDELKQTVISAESAKANKQIAKEITDQGAKLVCTSEHWTVYHITSFEASQKYGRDTRWCITGVNNWGDKYWKDYTSKGITFYFLIANKNYDPRGKTSKIALAIYPNKSCEVYNQQDTLIPVSGIPYLEEVNIPGISLSELSDMIRCLDCDTPLKPDEIWTGLHDEVYCEECFYETYFKCTACGETFYRPFFKGKVMCEDELENTYCKDCIGDLTTPGPGFYYDLNIKDISSRIKGRASTEEEVVRRLINHMSRLTTGNRTGALLEIIDCETGEILFDTTENALSGSLIRDIERIQMALNISSAGRVNEDLNNLNRKFFIRFGILTPDDRISYKELWITAVNFNEAVKEIRKKYRNTRDFLLLRTEEV